MEANMTTIFMKQKYVIEFVNKLFERIPIKIVSH